MAALFLSVPAPMLWGMKVFLVLEVDVDEGVRPSTRFRRLDSVVRSLGAAADRIRHVRSVTSIRVCDPAELDKGTELVRYDGAQFTASPGVPVGS